MASWGSVLASARELLPNVVHHSRAQHASVTLGITDGICVLDVADDGVGISDEEIARRLGEGHIGLASHRTRVDAAGGRISVGRSELGGFRLEVTL